MDAGPSPFATSFAAGVAEHFARFLEQFGATDAVDADPFIVRIQLATGEVYILRGLWTTFSQQYPDCVMLHGRPAVPDEAVVVRDEHIVAATFFIERPDDDGASKFGFAARKS